MKYIENITMREINRELGRIWRRIKSLENSTDVVLRSTPMANPTRGSTYFDSGEGTFNVWNGTAWDVYYRGDIDGGGI